MHACVHACMCACIHAHTRTHTAQIADKFGPWSSGTQAVIPGRERTDPREQAQSWWTLRVLGMEVERIG